MWTWPLSPLVVTDEFGMRFHPIDKVWRLHRGIDLMASMNQPVYAAGDGTISWAGYNGGEGNSVHVIHGDASKTKYFHNVSIHKHSGPCTGGQTQLAGAGSTGASTGVHCHFETHTSAYNDSPVNPRDFMAARGAPFGQAPTPSPTPNPNTEEDDDMAPKLALHIVRHDDGRPTDTSLYIWSPFSLPQDGNSAAVRERVFRSYGGVPTPTPFYEDEFKTLEDWIKANQKSLAAA